MQKVNWCLRIPPSRRNYGGTAGNFRNLYKRLIFWPQFPYVVPYIPYCSDMRPSVLSHISVENIAQLDQKGRKRHLSVDIFNDSVKMTEEKHAPVRLPLENAKSSITVSP